MSRVVKKNSYRPPQSTGLLKAMQQISNEIGGEASEISGLFGQIRKVVVNNSLILQNSSDFDIDFEIPFDDDAEINESIITVYNLSPTTLGQIKEGVPITVEAGYEKDSIGQILSGRVIGVRSYWDDLDYVTEIKCNDYIGTSDQELKDIAFPANTAGSQILKDLADRLGIPIAIFQVARDHVFENPVKISGSIMDSLRKYAKVCGVHAWINKSNLYICPLATPISEGYFDLKTDTGLLSVEEWQETETLEQSQEAKKAGEKAQTETIHGVTVKMLLQHRIYTGCTIQITSRNVNGRFKVREGSHSADDDSFTTTVKAERMG